MSKQTVIKDVKNKRLVVERRFDVSRQQLWQAWSDQQTLERWWGPRNWPAATASFEFRDGGHWHYHMTRPDGTEAWAWVDFINVDEPNSITAEDSFCDREGVKATDAPVSQWLIEFEGDKPTTLRTTLTFTSGADLQRIIEMGFESGYTESLDKLEEQLAMENNL